MGQGLLGKLWNRRAEPSAELTSVLGDLDRVIAARPELAEPGATLSGVLRAAFLVPPVAISEVPEAATLLIARGEGVPAFRAAPPPLDGGVLRARGMAICRALRSRKLAAAGPLLAVLGSRRVDLSACWFEGMAGRPETIDGEADALGLDLGLLLSVLRLALLPELAGVSQVYASVRPEGPWHRGDCPHCGHWPVLAESRGLEQRRRLRCGWCAADWPGDRLRCPFCSTNDHQALHYRFVEGDEGRHRLASCDRCDGRLKVVSTLAPLSAPSLLVTELATVHLDLIDGR